MTFGRTYNTGMAEDTRKPWRDTTGIPEPPWHGSRKPASRTPLTREAIVDAALRVLDAQRSAVDAVMEHAITSLSAHAAPPRLPG